MWLGTWEFEPTASCAQSRRAPTLHHSPMVEVAGVRTRVWLGSPQSFQAIEPVHPHDAVRPHPSRKPRKFWLRTSLNACNAVKAAVGIAAASLKVKFWGIMLIALSRARTYSAWEPRQLPKTASPTLNLRTFFPTASTLPATSMPKSFDFQAADAETHSFCHGGSCTKNDLQRFVVCGRPYADKCRCADTARREDRVP